MNYCGLTINNEPMCVKIPDETIKELFKNLNEFEFRKSNFETIAIIIW
jgi:predicted secreted Zn-dependent protease